MNMAISQPLRAAPAGINLADRAMLVSVNITQWAGRKLDRDATNAAQAAFQAESDSGRFNKLLIGAAALAPIAKIAGKARNETYYMTAPWLDDGARILPAALFERYSATMQKLRADFESSVAAFVLAYPGLIEESRARLGGMFAESDYPAAGEIGKRFSFAIRYLPIPSAGDFRVDVPGADRIRADIAESQAAVMQAAHKATFARVIDAVEHMAEKLAAYVPGGENGRAQHVFRDSLVDNLRDLVDLLPGLNLSESAAMENLRKLVDSHLCRHDAETLRIDPKARAETARAAGAIVSKMREFI